LVPGIPPDLDALCVELLSREPHDRPTGEEILARLESRPAPAGPQQPRRAALLGGRRRHPAALGDALHATRAGRGVAMHVHGPSGMGKSALVQCFLDDLAERADVVILMGRCYERESVPYKALDALVDALSRYLGRLQPLEAQALLPRDVQSL